MLCVLKDPHVGSGALVVKAINMLRTVVYYLNSVSKLVITKISRRYSLNAPIGLLTQIQANVQLKPKWMIHQTPKESNNALPSQNVWMIPHKYMTAQNAPIQKLAVDTCLKVCKAIHWATKAPVF